MAVAVCEQSQGGLCIGVALQPLLEGCDRRVELPQGNSRLILAAADLRGIANSPLLTNLSDQPLGLI